MKNFVVIIRWLGFILGIASAIFGLALPTYSNEANFMCWIFMFIAVATTFPKKN